MRKLIEEKLEDNCHWYIYLAFAKHLERELKT